MAPKIERLTESSTLGEGPHWDIPSQSLFYVDIFGQKILKYTPSTNKLTKASLAPRSPSFIVPVEGRKNQFVVGLDEEIVIVSWDGESDKATITETLASTKDRSNKPTFNDGKADPAGRLWAGAHKLDLDDFEKTLPVGVLFSLDSKKILIAQTASDIKCANGLAFNEKDKKFFYIDTVRKVVDQYDYDNGTGNISNQRPWFSFDKHKLQGYPDGMTIDSDGNLWVANVNGGKVLKVDGHKSETLLQTVELPAIQVTSVAFGGPKLDELYVTTGAFEFVGQKPEPPVNGATYRITGLGVKGLPATNFKI